jgi:hypothetical protein
MDRSFFFSFSDCIVCSLVVSISVVFITMFHMFKRNQFHLTFAQVFMKIWHPILITFANLQETLRIRLRSSNLFPYLFSFYIVIQPTIIYNTMSYCYLINMWNIVIQPTIIYNTMSYCCLINMWNIVIYIIWSEIPRSSTELLCFIYTIYKT